jgi:hypothetical protein
MCHIYHAEYDQQQKRLQKDAPKCLFVSHDILGLGLKMYSEAEFHLWYNSASEYTTDY